jgi:glycosyltransferase involved in cell wall biosynthesis
VKVLCAIPCLNEEVAIGSVVLRARAHSDDVLVIDDGSKDRTAAVARMAGATVITHDVNRGKGAAYMTLWRYTREHGFDALVVLDGDGQHDADEIPLLLAELKAGADLVIGARWGATTEMPWWRRIGKRALDYTTAMATDRKPGVGGPRLTDSQSGFRAYSARALATIEPAQAGFAVESQMLIDASEKGLKLAETRIHCRYDVDGSTEGAVAHAGGVINDLLTQVGIRRPLLLMGLPGFLGVVIGTGCGLWAVSVYERTRIFAIGWVLLAMLLVNLGVLGMFAGILFNLLPRSSAEAVRKALVASGALKQRP